MDEGQARNPNTTYNGYKMEFWKFALTWKLIYPVKHKITQKEQKETTKKVGISLTIMGQRQTYNSIQKPQRSPNETLGFNQDDHPYRMCNETGIPEFLELQIPGILMVVMVTSRAHSCAILPNKILSTHAPYLYMNVTHVPSSEEPSKVHYAI